MELTIDELFDAICKLEIISIVLDNDDNPQLIFESLNSTGLDLSEGDKIRNFILMGLPSAKQNDYYEKYWNKIEINTKKNGRVTVVDKRFKRYIDAFNSLLLVPPSNKTP